MNPPPHHPPPPHHHLVETSKQRLRVLEDGPQTIHQLLLVPTVFVIVVVVFCKSRTPKELFPHCSVREPADDLGIPPDVLPFSSAHGNPHDVCKWRCTSQTRRTRTRFCRRHVQHQTCLLQTPTSNAATNVFSTCWAKKTSYQTDYPIGQMSIRHMPEEKHRADRPEQFPACRPSQWVGGRAVHRALSTRHCSIGRMFHRAQFQRTDVYIYICTYIYIYLFKAHMARTHRAHVIGARLNKNTMPTVLSISYRPDCLLMRHFHRALFHRAHDLMTFTT